METIHAFRHLIFAVSTLLNASEKRKAFYVLCMLIVTSLLEAAGVASVMPFVSVLTDPDVIDANEYLSFVYGFLGFEDKQFFIMALGGGFIFVYISALSCKMLTTYAILRFSYMRQHTLGRRLLSAYLRQPYTFFLERNTSDMEKSILSEVTMVTMNFIMPLLRLFSGAVIVVVIVALLISLEPLTSFIMAMSVGALYGILYAASRNMLHRFGRERLSANKKRFIFAAEALNGVKELRLLGREKTYLHMFSDASFRFSHYQSLAKAFGLIPYFGVQILAFSGLVCLLLVLNYVRGGLQEALPVVSLFVFAAYRLIPAFQEVFVNSTQIKTYMPAVEELHKDLLSKESNVSTAFGEKTEPAQLRRSLELQNVVYVYPGAESAAIDGVSLRVNAKSSMAFVGSTGSGKSTLVDLMLGLLTPTSGDIIVDGKPLTGRLLPAWQRNIGYVPQSIFLADDTVAANIAFGLGLDERDADAVVKAAKAAHIHDFIVNELPQAYDTLLGERGVRLSGGQRQRVAIARALYHDPDVLVFDEATSALDTVTEKAVMQSVENLFGKKTIIMVAHRLSTVKRCSCICVMQNGKITSSGTFEELSENSKVFAALIHSSEE